MGQCRDLKGSAVKSVVLGIKLVGASAASREQIAEEVLADKKVQKALHDTFKKEVATITEARLTGASLDAAMAKQFIKPIQKAATPLAINQIKKQAEYTEFRSGLTNLKCAFDSTPMGVFIDEQKTWLIIAGVVIGAAGVVGMYKFKSGDIPAKGLALLTNNLADTVELGSFKLGLSGIDLEPSTRSGKGKLKLEIGKLKSVKVKQTLELSAAVKAGSLTEVMANETVVVPLAPSIQMKAQAAAGIKDNQLAYKMALTMKHNPGGGMTLGLSAYSEGSGSTYKHGVKATAGKTLDTSRILGPQSRTTLGATGKVETSRSAGSGYQTSGLLTVGLTATFN